MFRNFCIRVLNQAQRAKKDLAITSLYRQSSSYQSVAGLNVEARDKVLWLRLDRPEKYNALTREMYINLTSIFEQANHDKSIKALVLTGNGDYYSSGNDLSNLTTALQSKEGPQATLAQSRDILIRFVESLINLEKFLIAAVNGPAIGIAVTMLGLCDHVIASDRATFHTPFTALGQCPEACSSVLFPQIMGPIRASELLLFNRKWSAARAMSSNLVSDVVGHNQLYPHVEELLYGKQGLVANCYPNSSIICKSLIRNKDVKSMLSEVSRKESENLLKLWLSEESVEASKKFMSRSKK